MKQPIAGVIPADVEEATVRVVWPSVAHYDIGRWMGRQLNRKEGVYIFRVGNFIALALAPLAVFLYFYRLARGVHYRLTNRRIVVMRFKEEVRWLDLAAFDEINVETPPEYAWYRVGDLVFLREGEEVFRLPGVLRPEGFRQTCWKSHVAYSAVRQILDREAVSA